MTPRGGENRHVARSEATRAALIATARELFAERGYANVSTEAVVAHAGVTRGALYHQFEDKAALFRAVFEEVEGELAQRLAGEALAHEDPWEAQLAGLTAFLVACDEREIQQIALLDAPSVLGWETWREIEAQYGLGLVMAGLRNLIELGVIPDQPVEPAAHAILGAVAEAGLYVARAEDPEAARAEMNVVLRRMVEGLRA
jgi:AcrR family transcriptional regulator